MSNFSDWLATYPKLKSKYDALPASQQTELRKLYRAEGALAAQNSLKGKESAPSGDYSQALDWLEKHPGIKNKYLSLNATDRQTYLEKFNLKGRVDARTFLDSALNAVDGEEASTIEIADGVHVPSPTLYPAPSRITKPGSISTPNYNHIGNISDPSSMNVDGISVPNYNSIGGLQGQQLQRTAKLGNSAYEGGEGINTYLADSSTFDMTDPMAFASQYGEAYRNEVLKNANLADQIALQQLDTELAGLVDYASGSAALKRNEISIDNVFNQSQRMAQVESAMPGTTADLEKQRVRANAYAEGRLPDEMEDRMMELSARSRAVDASAAAGFGSQSLATQKASTLMAADQRLNVAQMGEGLLNQNISTKANLLMSPTAYSNVGNEINTMPSQSASVLAAASLGQLNELANVSATTALGSSISQEQFSANLVSDISKFNSALQKDTDTFNTTLKEQQDQFKANMQLQIDQFNAQMEASENLTQAEIDQRTSEFNANMAVQQSQFSAGLQQSIESFNAQLAVTQNQFNTSMQQRTREFNANLGVTQAQYDSTLQQRIAEYNTTMEYNTNVANTGIENAFSLGRFDYNVTYKGMVAGALNKAADTALQMKLAYAELGYYQDALNMQMEFEREKLEIINQKLKENQEYDADGNPVVK